MANQTMNITFGQTVRITVTGKDSSGNVKSLTNIHVTTITAPGALQVVPVSGTDNQFDASMPTNQAGANQINWSATNELGNSVSGSTPVQMTAVIPATVIETTYSTPS